MKLYRVDCLSRPLLTLSFWLCFFFYVSVNYGVLVISSRSLLDSEDEKFSVVLLFFIFDFIGELFLRSVVAFLEVAVRSMVGSLGSSLNEVLYTMPKWLSFYESSLDIECLFIRRLLLFFLASAL